MDLAPLDFPAEQVRVVEGSEITWKKAAVD